MRCQLGSPLFLGWYNSEAFAISPAQSPTLYRSVPKWWCEEYETAPSPASFTAPSFAYCSTLLHDTPVDHALWNVPFVEDWALTFCSLLKNYHYGALFDIRQDPRIRLVNDQRLVAIRGLLHKIVSFITCHKIVCLPE